MRNKHLFERFMKENGLEFNVPFTAEYEKISCDKDIYELEIRKVQYGTGEEIEIVYVDDDSVAPAWLPPALVFDCSFKIVKMPWKPKEGELYWYVRFDANNNSIVTTNRWSQHSFDFTKYIIGNCFKTKEEAEEHIDDVFKILKGEPLVKWEE